MNRENELYNELKEERERLADRFLTNDEYDKIMSVSDNEKYLSIRNIMRVMKETGMRYSSFDYLTVEGIKAGKIKCMIKRRI